MKIEELTMSDFVICYYIHGQNNEIVGTAFKDGSSVEVLEEWAKNNNVKDYKICINVHEVERVYVKPLEEIKTKAKNIMQEADEIKRWAK